MSLYGKIVCPMLGALTTDGWTYVTGLASTGDDPWLTPTATVTWGTPSSGGLGGTVAASNQPTLSISSAIAVCELVGVYLVDAALGANISLAATSGVDWMLAHLGGDAFLDTPSTFTEAGTFTLTALSVSVDYEE